KRICVLIYKRICVLIQENLCAYISCSPLISMFSAYLKALKALKIIKSLSRGECKLPYVLAKARTLLKLVPRFVGQFLVNPVCEI
ncbi:hypothetical protein, partial [Acinetobacter baumannii]|uniref:hypothetical protein n=1 Tax=Acinetobacter baumannii TaxID=470 RepID=UPI0024B7233A